MNDQEIKKWAKQFAEELRLADEPAIIDQVVGRHLRTLEFLKSRLRWNGIVNILTQAGARREDGKSPLSEDQLRASRSRMRRRQNTNAAPQAQAATNRRVREILPDHKESPTCDTREDRPQLASKDVSESEVAAALERIARSHKK